MRQYALRRLAYLPIIAVAVSMLTFGVLRSPWSQDPVIVMAGMDATPEQQQAIREELGLDDPIPVQFLSWIGNLARGDLGETFRGRQPVSEQVRVRIPATAEILFLSVFFSAVFGIGWGVIAAVRQNSGADYTVRTFAVFGQSIPDFFLLVLLVVLPSIWWNYSSPVGRQPGFFEDPLQNLRLYVPPTLLLAVGGSSAMVRVTRSTLLEVLRQDYMRTARAKGLATPAVIWQHAFRNALIPIVTLLGGQIVVFFFGALILEQVFSINGLGQFFYTSVLFGDFPVVQFLVLYTALIVVTINLIVDLSYALIDPRVKYT
ncbi:MAG: ABC transporter permease [Dehalococcoidia bacterium]